MQKTANIVPGILFLIVVLLTGVEAQASGFAILQDEERMQFVTTVCVVDVESVKVKKNRKFFLPASIRTLTTSYQLKGRILESLKGECGEGDFTSQYTTPQSVDYDAFGNITAYYTLLSLDSGLESNVEPGQTYILSYLSYETDSKIHHHDRVDSMADYDIAVGLIKNQNQR